MWLFSILLPYYRQNRAHFRLMFILYQINNFYSKIGVFAYKCVRRLALVRINLIQYTLLWDSFVKWQIEKDLCFQEYKPPLFQGGTMRPHPHQEEER